MQYGWSDSASQLGIHGGPIGFARRSIVGNWWEGDGDEGKMEQGMKLKDLLEQGVEEGGHQANNPTVWFGWSSSWIGGRGTVVGAASGWVREGAPEVVEGINVGP